MHNSAETFKREIKPLSMYIAMTGAMLRGQENAQHQMQQMVKGMQRYQSSDFQPKRQEHEIFWTEGQSRLYRLEAKKEKARDSVLLVPSLVNKSHIFDLCEERSMAGWYAAQGYDVYILDWGNLLKEQGISISNVCARLARAFDYLQSQKPGKVNCIGYCMGGIVCLGASHLNQNSINCLTLLATPWDFHKGGGTLLNLIKFWAPSALLKTEKKEKLSAESLQMLFASVEPLLAQKKFSKFLDMKEGSAEEHIFIAVEDWLNDATDIPQKIAVEAIENWYLKNTLAKSAWYVNDELVDIAKLNVPVCIVASKKDRLVDYESSLAVHEKIQHVHVIEPNCGHIGMIAGKKSVQDVWTPISEWMKAL